MPSPDVSKSVADSIREQMQHNRSVKIFPKGYSMYPLLEEERDSVIVSPLSSDKLHFGNIYLYQRENGLLVLHRLAGVRKGAFYFVGDNQTQLEGPLSLDRILGVVTSITRKGKTFSTCHPLYRTITTVWLMVRPIRPFFWKLGRIAKNICICVHSHSPFS